MTDLIGHVLYIQDIFKHTSITYFSSGCTMEARETDDGDAYKTDFVTLIRLELAIVEV